MLLEDQILGSQEQIELYRANNMKRILLLLLLFPLLTLAQGNQKNEIEWITLKKAEYFAKKYNKNILIFFYRPGCDYCENMKKETLSNPIVIKQINENFLPVMLNGKSKKPITYNGKTYVNDHPNPEDAPWRHNLFVELVDPVRGNYYWPNVVIINSKHNKLAQFPGFQPTPQLLRSIKKFIK